LGFTLPYTDTCSKGIFAACKAENTVLILAYGEGDAWMSMHKHHEVIEIQDLLHKESWTTPIAPPKLSWGDPAPLAWGGRASALPAAAGALVVASADDATNGGASDNQGFLPVGPALTGNSLPPPPPPPP